MKSARRAVLLLLLASAACAATRTRSSYAWQKLCTIYPPFKDDIKTERRCPDAAGAALNEFIAKYPNAAETPRALYLLGQFHYSRGEASAAVRAYWRCVKLAPRSKPAEDASFGIVKTYANARMWDAGRKQLDRLAKALPKRDHVASLERRFNALEHTQVGKPPLQFEVPDIDGQPLSLAMHKGKVVVLVFWATWCPPCRREIPLILSALKQVDPKDVAVVSVSLDTEVGELTDFGLRMGINWRHRCDGKRYDGDVPRLYDITQIPQLFLIGRKGILRYVNTRGPLIAPRLKELVAERD